MLKMVRGVQEICIESETLTVRFALTPSEIEQAQKLRYHVFTTELGASLPDVEKQIDADEYDPYCFHLIAIDKPSHSVVGTYRILTPENAQTIGRYYSENEFDLSHLVGKKDLLVEFGRSCTHPDHRNGTVIMNMLAALTRFIFVNHYRYVFGCASVSLKNNAQDVIAALQFVEKENPPCDGLVLQPITRYPSQIPVDTSVGSVPPLIKAYLRIGARVAGDPAWDPVFDVLDFPVLMQTEKMNPRYLERFSKTLHIESMNAPL